MVKGVKQDEVVSGSPCKAVSELYGSSTTQVSLKLKFRMKVATTWRYLRLNLGP